MKKIVKLSISLCLSVFFLMFYSLESRAAEEYTDLTEGAEYDEEEGILFHPDGDGILVSDYTIPENTYLGWYNGNLTIASGVTLTIPKGSTLHVSAGTEFVFTVEEGACIRIEGDLELDEWGDPRERLQVSFTKTYMNGIIESESTGIQSDHNKLYMNGIIHSKQSSVLARECQVFIWGGEYLSSNTPNSAILNMDPDCKSLIEISGGIFSGKGIRDYLSEGYIYEEHENGVRAVLAASSESGKENEPIGVEERILGITGYAKELFMEAKGDSITESGSWINGDIVVVILCVVTVLIILIYVIFDFIRSPWKKKLKILLELIIAIGLVGGVLWYFWNQAVKETKEQQKSSAIHASYQEELVPEKVLIQSSDSILNGLDAYPEGLYQVGKDLDPGTYFFEAAAPNSEACFYIYFSRKADLKEKEIGAWMRRCYVELKTGDYIYVQDANFVKSGEQPAYQTETQFPKGEYLVGYDMEPGTYRVGTANDVYVRNTAITGTEVNFSIYNQDSFVNGDSVELVEGQYINTGIWGSMTLTKE